MRPWQFLGNDEWSEPDLKAMDTLADGMQDWNAGSVTAVGRNEDGAITCVHSIAHIGDGVLVGFVLSALDDDCTWAMR